MNRFRADRGGDSIRDLLDLIPALPAYQQDLFTDALCVAFDRGIAFTQASEDTQARIRDLEKERDQWKAAADEEATRGTRVHVKRVEAERKAERLERDLAQSEAMRAAQIGNVTVYREANERLERENARLRAVATAAAYVYRALGYHQTIVHPEPAPAPVLPMRDLYEALLAAGYTIDGEYVEVPAALAPAAGSQVTTETVDTGRRLG